ncbi:MAG: hypothetical protein VYB93_10550 [Pseudomonadota bacterium]|nr:hypothetical protein [Pseudomonadota bacterium]
MLFDPYIHTSDGIQEALAHQLEITGNCWVTCANGFGIKAFHAGEQQPPAVEGFGVAERGLVDGEAEVISLG